MRDLICLVALLIAPSAALAQTAPATPTIEQLANSDPFFPTLAGDTLQGVDAWIGPEGHRRLVAGKKRAFADEVDLALDVRPAAH
ncbi:MAG: hypothetical protein U1E59_09865 [Amaricoccus sp.]